MSQCLVEEARFVVLEYRRPGAQGSGCVDFRYRCLAGCLVVPQSDPVEDGGVFKKGERRAVGGN